MESISVRSLLCFSYFPLNAIVLGPRWVLQVHTPSKRVVIYRGARLQGRAYQSGASLTAPIPLRDQADGTPAPTRSRTARVSGLAKTP
jgi:hypothetical protein